MPWPIEESSGEKPQRIIRIGRDPDNDVVLDVPAVSSFHAEIHVTEDRYLVTDLDSTNGTAIGAADRLVQTAEIRPTDVLFFRRNVGKTAHDEYELHREVYEAVLWEMMNFLCLDDEHMVRLGILEDDDDG